MKNLFTRENLLVGGLVILEILLMVLSYLYARDYFIAAVALTMTTGITKENPFNKYAYVSSGIIIVTFIICNLTGNHVIVETYGWKVIGIIPLFYLLPLLKKGKEEEEGATENEKLSK
jgi:hypothetical protein